MSWKKLFKMWAVFLVVGGNIVACVESSKPWNNDDSWYRPPTSDVKNLSGWLLLESTRVHEVASFMEPSAEQLLEKASYQHITREQAKEMIGSDLTDDQSMRFYLVRSLYLNKFTGGYYVSVENGNLWVHHASLGRSATPMKRQALIVQLNAKPQEVYVTCSMSE